MSADKIGRHSGVCEKTVVDFTEFSKEEIKTYFKIIAETKSEIPCGYFNTEDLDQEENIKVIYKYNFF